MTAYKKMPDPRHDLPDRRLCETRRVETPEGHTIHLTVGFDPDEPDRPREVFYSGGFRSGSQLEFQVQDACVLISLLLQHGLTPDAVLKSLAKTEQPGLWTDGVEEPEAETVHASHVGLIMAELASAE
ncbi:MAG: hypothetical protein WBA25_16270 [Jannaschia sp.]